MTQLGHNKGDVVVLPYAMSYLSSGDNPINWTAQAYTAKQIYNASTSSVYVNEFTHSSAGRLTYTGALTRQFKIMFDCGVLLTAAGHAGHYLMSKIYKSGSALDDGYQELDISLSNGSLVGMSRQVVTTLATNDYVEVFGWPTTNTATEIEIYEASLTIVARG